jgi:hypothetical protein
LERGGGDRVDGRIHDIADLEEFRKVLPMAAKDKDTQILVIDTIDQLSAWMEDEIAAKYGLESITERKQGVDSWSVWSDYRQRVENLTTYLRSTNKLVVLLAHCREPKTDATGNVITPRGINMPGKSGSFLAAQADAIGYTFKKEINGTTKHYITFRGGPLGDFGSRIDELNDKQIELPKENAWAAIEAACTDEDSAKTDKPAAKTAGKGSK